MSNPVSAFIERYGWPVSLQMIGIFVVLIGGNRGTGGWDTFISGILILAGYIIFAVGVILLYRSKRSARFLVLMFLWGVVIFTLAVAVFTFGSNGAILGKYVALIEVRTDEDLPTTPIKTPTIAPAWHDEAVRMVSQYYSINNSASSEDEFAAGWEMLSSAVTQDHNFEDDYAFWLGNENNPDGLRAKVSMYDCGDPVLGVRLDYYYREDVNLNNPIGSFDELFISLLYDEKLFIAEGGLSNCDLINPNVSSADVSSSLSGSPTQRNWGSTVTFIGIGALLLAVAALRYGFVKRGADPQTRLVIENNWNQGEGSLWAHVLAIKNIAPYHQPRAIARELVATIQFFDLDENPVTKLKESHFWNNELPVFPHAMEEVSPVEKPDLHPQESVFLPIAYRVGNQKEVFEYEFASRTDQEWVEEGKSLGSRAIYLDVWIEGRNLKKHRLQRYLIKFKQQGLDAQGIAH